MIYRNDPKIVAWLREDIHNYYGSLYNGLTGVDSRRRIGPICIRPIFEVFADHLTDGCRDDCYWCDPGATIKPRQVTSLEWTENDEREWLKSKYLNLGVKGLKYDPNAGK